MAEARKPAASTDALSPSEELASAWSLFREGGATICPRDRGAMALAVDAAAGAYRFVCVQCGSSSPWFESGAAGLRLRGIGGPLAAAASPVGED